MDSTPETPDILNGISIEITKTPDIAGIQANHFAPLQKSVTGIFIAFASLIPIGGLMLLFWHSVLTAVDISLVECFMVIGALVALVAFFEMKRVQKEAAGVSARLKPGQKYQIETVNRDCYFNPITGYIKGAFGESVPVTDLGFCFPNNRALPSHLPQWAKLLPR